jgi:hypothetical protein
MEFLLELVALVLVEVQVLNMFLPVLVLLEVQVLVLLVIEL